MKKNIFSKDRIFLIVGFLLLFISYSFNPFNITDDNYKMFDRGDESNIISRLMMSRDEGIFSRGGLTGAYFFHQYELEEGEEIPHTLALVDGDESKVKDLEPLLIVAQGYDDYIKDRKTYNGEWSAYKTQPGGQAFLYVILDNILPFDNGTKLILYRLITILLSVIAFMLITKWILNNFGFVAALTTFILIFFSAWFFRFAYNLWWALWSYYIPFVTMLFVLDKKLKNRESISDTKVFFLLFLTVFLKFFFTGAEFITSTLVMTVCPVIFYLLVTKVKLKEGLIYFIKSSIASILGVLAGMLLLIVQIRAADGSWKAGLDHILYSFVKRSVYAEDIVVIDTWSVIADCFKTNMFFFEFAPSFGISFGAFLLFTSILSIAVYYMSKYINGEVFLKNKALVITTLISVMGPLSWIVLFVQHVYVHPMFDPIVWYMPYCIYGFCVIGVFINLSILLLKNKRGEVLTTKD